MAEVKYKFGADELDLLDYISNLEHNVQGYLNSKNWNEGLKAEFAEAYRKILSAYQDQLKTNSGRFSTDSLGWITDTLGEFSNKDNDNIDPVGSDYYYDNKGNQITTDDYNALKKRKQGNYAMFQANREVANFFNTVGKALAKARTSKTTSSNPFNLANHGFEKWWLGLNNPSGGNFDYAPYVDKDTPDENGVRGTTNRALYLKELLENYLNNLEDYDYSNTPFKNKDTYVLRLRAAIDNLANGYNSEDTIALQLAGLSSDFLNNFFATKTTDTKDKVLLAAEYLANEEKRKKDEATMEEANRVRAMNELDEYVKDKPFVASYSGLLDPTNVDYNEESIGDMLVREYPNLEGDDKVKAWLNFELILNYLKDPNSVLGENMFVGDPNIAMKEFKLDLAKRLKFAAELGYLQTYGENNKYIIPGSENRDNYSVITYNPITGDYIEESVILNDKLREAMAYNMYKENHKVLSNKNGGSINYLLNGGFMLRYYELKKQKQLQEQLQEQQKETVVKEQAKKENRTPEEIKAGLRKPLETGLSTTDLVRLGAAAADVLSAIASFVPVYGTAVSAGTGIASTLANLGADIAEDGMQLSDFGNAAIGLGMDAIGLVPVYGAAAKAGKIARTLKILAPTVTGIFAANGLISSKDALSKLLKDPSSMNVDDWKDLSVGLQAIAGGARYVGGIKAARRMQGALGNPQTSYLIDTNKGKVELTPELYSRFRKGKDITELQSVIHEVNPDANLNSEYYSRWKRVRHPFHKNPKVQELTNYVEKDWTKEEYLPKGFTVKDGKVVPKYWMSDAWIYGRKLNKSSNVSKKKLTENPLYKSKTKEEKKTSNTSSTRQPIIALETPTSTALVPTNPKKFNPYDSNAARVDQQAAELRLLNRRKRLESIARIDDELSPLTKKLNTPEARLLLANDIFNTKVERAVNANAGNVRTLQLREMVERERLKKLKVAPQISNPLTKAEYEARLKELDLVFGKVNLVTIPEKVSLTPKILRRPSKSLHDKKQIELEEVFSTKEQPLTIEKSEKGLRREQYKKVRELAEEEKRLVNELPYLSEKKKRELAQKKKEDRLDKPGRSYTSKQDTKKKVKKTSRDDKSTVKRQEGGTLDLNKVRKFLNSGAITYTPTGKNGVRKKDSYTFDTSLRLQATLDRIKNGSMTVNDANQFLRRHYGMYSNWKQAPMTGGDINQYQTDYQGLGLNDAVIAPGFNNNYDILSSNPTSGDSLTKKWTIDGIYDQITDDRRVMARAADYEGRPEKLAADKAAAQAAGYEYYLDPDTQYYMLKPIVAPIDKGIMEETPVTSEKTVIQTETPSIDEPTAQPNNIFAKLFNNPTLTYGLPRALYADRMNRRITDMAKAAVTPLLKDPLEVHRYTRSDLDAEMLGERNYADLRLLASRPLTSDGSLQTAGLLEAELKGLAARTAGKEKSNQTLRQYNELAWQLEKENAANRHETAMFNRALQWGAALDKAKMEQAYQSKKFNIWDTFGQLLEYDARVKLKENKALEDRFAQLDIHNETTNNLAKYAPDLSVEALNIWNQVVSGNTTPSQLQSDPAKWQLYQQALRAQLYAETELLRKHYGISPSPYDRVRQQAYTVLIKRRGGKVNSTIAVAGIKAKTADAERFQRQIKACIDRNEKAIDRLSKSLYGIIKASILK